ncbi:acyl-CoA thioesterase [Halocynthiibacter styelae]|uniref:Acyl-CoA thioesterase n=1 Tax=Halocynthiibacter styelae TaxID=2761955 RepID=A0A8J7LWZ1_9RHOB|nr:thioesterase family protein [Paenihalocynthiibacter styelae]MBI1495007.1 acyl-CoA thioesterase [Paenihalocynthiibacter styelae]
MPRPTPMSRCDFTVHRRLQTRWSDNDAYGHMNNTVHYQLFDTVINHWLMEQGLLDFRQGEIVGLVVETGCSYFAELAFPQEIIAGIAVEKIGKSSVTYRIALFGQGETAAAQGRFTHVYVDRVSRRPVSFPQNWRDALLELQL